MKFDTSSKLYLPALHPQTTMQKNYSDALSYELKSKTRHRSTSRLQLAIINPETIRNTSVENERKDFRVQVVLPPPS